MAQLAVLEGDRKKEGAGVGEKKEAKGWGEMKGGDEGRKLLRGTPPTQAAADLRARGGFVPGAPSWSPHRGAVAA